MIHLKMSTVVVQYLNDAVADTFASFGAILAPSDKREAANFGIGETMAAMMGLYVEATNGTFLLTAERSDLERLMAGKLVDQSETLLNDWFGEAANLCVGHLKQALLCHNIKVRISPPSVTQAGLELFSNFADRVASTELYFKLPTGGALAGFFAIDAESIVTLNTQTRTEPEGLPKPGDVIVV